MSRQHVPPSPGTQLVGEQAQLDRLKDNMQKVLGPRLNKRQGLTDEHYKIYQRALCGVSTDADFRTFEAAWRGSWSTEIQPEVSAQVNRLQHSTGFRFFKVSIIPLSSVVFEPLFGGAQSPAVESSGSARSQGQAVGGDLKSVQDSFSKQISGLEARHADMFAKAQRRHDDLLQLMKEQQVMLQNFSKHFTPQSAKADDTNVEKGREQSDDVNVDINSDQPGGNKKQKTSQEFSFAERYENVMGKSVAEDGEKSVDDLLSSVFQEGDKNPVIELDQPEGAGRDVGVPSDRTKEAMESHLEPPPPRVTSQALKEQVCDFVRKSNASLKSAGQAAGLIRKQQVKQLLEKLDAASPAELAEYQGQGSWMQELIHNDTKSSGELSCDPCQDVYVPRPLCKVRDQGLYTPYHFLPRASQTSDDVISDILDWDEDESHVLDDAAASKGILKKSFKQVQDITDVTLAASRLIDYARHFRAVRMVKHLHTQSHFLAHTQYLDKLVALSKTYRLEYVIKYDIEFRKRVHSASLSVANPWMTAKDTDIFQMVLVVPGDAARKQDNQGTKKRKGGGEQVATKKKTKKKMYGVDFSKFAGKKDSDGNEFCFLYNAGKECKFGQDCKRSHKCIKCGEGHPFKGNCDSG